MYVVDHAYSLIIIKVEFSLSYKSTSFSCSVKVFASQYTLGCCETSCKHVDYVIMETDERENCSV